MDLRYAIKKNVQELSKKLQEALEGRTVLTELEVNDILSDVDEIVLFKRANVNKSEFTYIVGRMDVENGDGFMIEPTLIVQERNSDGDLIDEVGFSTDEEGVESFIKEMKGNNFKFLLYYSKEKDALVGIVNDKIVYIQECTLSTDMGEAVINGQLYLYSDEEVIEFISCEIADSLFNHMSKDDYDELVNGVCRKDYPVDSIFSSFTVNSTKLKQAVKGYESEYILKVFGL